MGSLLPVEALVIPLAQGDVNKVLQAGEIVALDVENSFVVR